MKLPRPKRIKLDRDEYTAKLRKDRDMKYIGSGAFATVFGRNDYNRVVKVGHACEGFDDPYLQFVELVGLKSRNIHFPRIYKVELFKGTEGEKFYAVEMERLVPYGKVRTAAAKKAFKQSLGIPYIERMEEPDEMFPSTRHGKRVQKVLKVLYRRDNNPDMHDGNIMWRKKGRGYQLVITDPVA